MTNPIIPAPTVPPSVGTRLTPQFDYQQGSYSPRPDTLSSMATFAKKNSKWLILGTLVLTFLYALYSIITRKPPSSSDHSEKNEEDRKDSGINGGGGEVGRPKTATKIESTGAETIIGKEELKHSDIAYQFVTVYKLLHRKDATKMPYMITQPLTALMKHQLGSSGSFISKIQNGDKKAFAELVEAIFSNCEVEVKSQKVVVLSSTAKEMDFIEAYPRAFDKISGEYPIVTKFGEVITK